ncbi:D-lactate ferricytochrome c oxidoreductase [Paramarasmius palmivorus]|uniref:D-lactate dehydrogenase (cytochrome) n=1 Tax=Paramarasmius palmivorus TaxID=297713 RepID=A0AAW0DSZ5_9AGAR
MQTVASSSSGSKTSYTRNLAVAVVVSAAISGALGYLSSTRKPKHVKGTSFTTTYGSHGDLQYTILELKAELGADNVSTDPEVLQAHGVSPLRYPETVPHSVVVYPRSTEDVVRIVKIANEYRMPVIAYSGGTSLEGHFRGHEAGSICLDMSNMNRVLEIHEEDSDVVCQPGIGWMELNGLLEEKGMFIDYLSVHIRLTVPLPQIYRSSVLSALRSLQAFELQLTITQLDPGPGATIGGMLSTGCSGTNAVKYGTSRGEWFLNATVVLPSGEVIKTRRRSRKSSAGFDTTKLFIGAEGTLGIVTEVTIRLAPVVPYTVAAVQFPDVRKATNAVIEVLKAGIDVQCVELLDNVFIRAINLHSESQMPELDSLFFKIPGHSPEVRQESAARIGKIVKKHGGTGFQVARDKEHAAELWHIRKNAPWSILALHPGAKAIGTDVCVPISKLPDLVYETKKDLETLGLVSGVIGHVGDGNFHAMIMWSDDTELAKLKEAVHRMVERAIALDGTCTGEHGVGIVKKRYLEEELGPGTVELMRTIKKAIDPLDLMNPGKLYPETDKDR